MHLSTSFFNARTVVASVLLVAVTAAALAEAQATDAQGCRTECYPNTKMINGKGGIGKNENCRWILRTDGKAARLCDHIKCKKVCPNNQAASSAAADQQQEAAASDNLRIEQQTESDAPMSASNEGQNMGIMRHLHGNKMSKAPVPGVAGGRLASGSGAPTNNQQAAPSGGRRMAPTMPPAVQYDENDTPPPISRFLDISPEE